MGRWNQASRLASGLFIAEHHPSTEDRPMPDKQLVSATRQSDSPPTSRSLLEDDDDPASLAREIAAAYRRMARFYHHQLELSVPEADRRARGLDYTDEEEAAERQRILDRPTDELAWFDFTRLAERSPDDLTAVWHRVRAEARRELESGHRTAHALEWRGGPWQRAQYLALRDSFRDDLPPRSGIEAALVDSAAEAFGDYLGWSEHLHMLESTEVQSSRRRVERDGEWTPMRLSYADAIAQAVTRTERAHQRFLRTVKMLHDLRRAPVLQIGHATQINVGQQQVNVLTRESSG
jgi:hypothetical protein